MTLFEFMRVCPNGTRIMLKDYNGEMLMDSIDKKTLESSSSYELFYQYEKVDGFVTDCLGIYIKLKFLLDYGSINDNYDE